MELTYAELSTAGPVRPRNEDCVGSWQPGAVEEKRSRGAIVVLADGVGGQGQGDVASRLAVDAAVQAFKSATEDATPEQLVTEAFNAANLAVFDRNHDNKGTSRMATTLAIAVFRNDQLCVGNVGDSRVYVVRRNQSKQISTDHSYVAMQRKFGLISEEEAKSSEHRSILTRSVGFDPTIRVDIEQEQVFKGDRVVLCSDGLHAHVSDGEIGDIVTRLTPAQACRQLVQLADKRGTDDNVSVQVVQIDEIESVSYYRGVPTYHKPVARNADVLQPGETLDDRFLILETVSRSGMATIYRATDQTNKQTVAIKVPFLQFESDPGFFARFDREEDIGLKLNHPYILKFVPVEKKSRPYIVTEYLRGYTLAHLLQSVCPMPVRDGLQLASRICDALQHLHENGVTHRDLKPQNIMICNDGTIRLMDFGIASSADSRRITFAGFSPALGTPHYMAPEQVKGKRGDARTDIYSLGAMLYEMLSGQPPFDGENPLVVMNARLSGDPVAPRKINPNLSPEVEEIILHAMERDPANRYPTALAMKAELDAPASVTVTGRADHLQAPTLMKSRLARLSPFLLAAIIPLIIIIIFTILAIRAHSGH
jgi:serine/threonine-protein kinase